MRLLRALFRLTLRLHPGPYRRTAGEALDAFERGLAARRARGTAAAFAYALAATGDAVLTGLRLRAALVATALRRSLGGIGRDLRHALTAVRKAPGFSLTVVGIAAVGIGATTTASSAVEAFVLSSPPFADSENLVVPRVRRTAPEGVRYTAWSWGTFRDLREGSGDALEAVAAYTVRVGTLTDPGAAESLSYELVSSGYFETLGLVPSAGRFFRQEEESPPAAPGVAVISHGMWLGRFGGDEGAVGRTLAFEGARLLIVGIAPPGFAGMTGSAALWVPIGQGRDFLGAWTTEWRTISWLQVIARIPPGRDLEGINPRLAALGRAIDRVEPAADEPGVVVDAWATPLLELWFSVDVRRSMTLAFAGAVVLLLVVTVNLVALFLARSRQRSRLRAIHLALGSGRWRVARQALAFSLLLAMTGSALGLLLARVGTSALAGLLPDHVFRGYANIALVDAGALGVGPRSVALALALAVLVGCVAGVAPLLGSAAGSLAPALRGDRVPGTGAAARERGWVPAAFIASQLALSVVLVVGTGLLFETVRRLHDEQRGFDPEGLLVGRYRTSPEGSRAFHEALRERLEAVPGVVSVALGTSPPLVGGYIETSVGQVGDDAPFPESARPVIGAHIVDHAWFATLGTELLEGRSFTEVETRRAEPVVVLTRRAAETLFPAGGAVGGTMRFRMNVADPSTSWRVVGVVEDILFLDPVAGIRSEVFVPTGIWAPPGLAALVRTEGEPGALVPAVRQALASVGPDVPFSSLVTGRHLRNQDVVDERALTWILGLFAGAATLLSVAGLQAQVVRTVAERRRDIGVRAALGAWASVLVRHQLMRVAIPVAVGVGGGVLLALPAGLVLRDRLYGIPPVHPPTLATVAAGFAVLALVAAWLPARRAARIDPAEAIREG